MELSKSLFQDKAGDKGISQTKSKQQSPCSNCMHRPVTSWGNACSTSMHKLVRCTHQLDVTGRCMHLLHGIQIFKFVLDIPYSSYFALEFSLTALEKGDFLRIHACLNFIPFLCSNPGNVQPSGELNLR